MPKTGFLIDVPVTLSVAVCGASLAEAKRIARRFAESLAASDGLAAFRTLLPEGVTVTEATLETSLEDSCEVLYPLEEA